MKGEVNMRGSAQGRLNSICSELNSVIGELDSIASGIAGDFTGVGNDRCAQSINSIVSKYQYVLRLLNNVDTSTVTDEWAASHGLKED